jgi:WD40 repeat protein
MYITNFRHYLDKNNKRDLIMSISSNDNNLKVWNVNIFQCLVNIRNINKNGFLNSACFLKDNNTIYVITSNLYFYSYESITVFDLN